MGRISIKQYSPVCVPCHAPVDESGNPDYAFMEQYIKERERQIVQSYIDYTSENIQMGGSASDIE